MEEVIENYLDSLKRCKVICGFFGKDLDADKIVSYNK